MTSLDIEIIGRLFEFLSSYEPDELSKAASSSLVTDNVRTALLALARARQNNRIKRASPHSADSPGALVSPTRQSDLLEAEIDAALNDKSVLPTNGDVVNILERVGIHITANRKDARSRVIERARREFGKLSSRDRDKKYKQLLRELRPTETQGWFKVIRGES